MSENFIFNMGYDTSHITSVLGKEGLSRGSRVILVTPEEQDERQRNSINDIDNYLESLDFRASLEEFQTRNSFQENVLKFAELFSNIENLALSLSGGPRDTLIALTVAANLKPGELEEVYFRSDIDSDLSELQLPGVGFDLDQKDQEILEKTQNWKSTSDLVNELEFSQSTLYRRLKSLEKQKLLETKKGGGKEYRKTVTGRIASKNSD